MRITKHVIDALGLHNMSYITDEMFVTGAKVEITTGGDHLVTGANNDTILTRIRSLDAGIVCLDVGVIGGPTIKMIEEVTVVDDTQPEVDQLEVAQPSAVDIKLNTIELAIRAISVKLDLVLESLA